MSKLKREFYTRNDVVEISKDLLGKVLVTNVNGIVTKAKIVETEAYCGRNDRAAHSFQKRTPRTEVMYDTGGKVYTYLCYGIHTLFNIVTNEKNLADAVLVRAVEPIESIDAVLERRNQTKLKRMVSDGPGKVSKAMDISLDHYGLDLIDNDIFIEDHKIIIHDQEIIESHRVGVDYAGEDALRNWRFRVKGNPFIGKDYAAKALGG
jgi:DNA-3-methyladenine glycosylase